MKKIIIAIVVFVLSSLSQSDAMQSIDKALMAAEARTKAWINQASLEEVWSLLVSMRGVLSPDLVGCCMVRLDSTTYEAGMPRLFEYNPGIGEKFEMYKQILKFNDMSGEQSAAFLQHIKKENPANLDIFLRAIATRPNACDALIKFYDDEIKRLKSLSKGLS